MDLEKARQLVRDARRNGRKYYSFGSYERFVDELCDRKGIDASKVGVEWVDTGELCITGMKVLTILEPKGSHETDPFTKQDQCGTEEVQ